jgi:hypothetical protein
MNHLATDTQSQTDACLHVAQAPRPRSVHHCADCHRASTTQPLYAMNGQQYCEICLLSWCVSLPVIRADLLAARQAEELGD